MDDVPVTETFSKMARLSPESSPGSGNLFLHDFAGSISNIQFGSADVDCLEQEIMNYTEDAEPHGDGMDVDESETLDEGKFPIASDEELDAETGFIDIQPYCRSEV